MLTGSSAKGDAVSPLAGRLIVVVGAGGAGKAVAYGAKEKGARVVVANRTYGNNFSYLSIMSNMVLLIGFFSQIVPNIHTITFSFLQVTPLIFETLLIMLNCEVDFVVYTPFFL
jgi:D-arabinose 1-dehydrogenase-like Zn-dependent alcohol dehydrogenase